MTHYMSYTHLSALLRAVAATAASTEKLDVSIRRCPKFKMAEQEQQTEE